MKTVLASIARLAAKARERHPLVWRFSITSEVWAINYSADWSRRPRDAGVVSRARVFRSTRMCIMCTLRFNGCVIYIRFSRFVQGSFETGTLLVRLPLVRSSCYGRYYAPMVWPIRGRAINLMIPMIVRTFFVVESQSRFYCLVMKISTDKTGCKRINRLL